VNPEIECNESAGPSDGWEVPEHAVVLLLEAGERFLANAEEAVKLQQPMVRDHFIRKVCAILQELHRRLNHEQGGDLVNNLVRVYDWWTREILDAAARNDEDQLRVIGAQMADIRRAWEHVLFQGVGLTENPEF